MLNRLPKFRGKIRLARILYSKKIAKSVDLMVDGKFGIRYKLPNIKETVGFSIFVNGIYEEDNIKFIIDRLPLNSILLDLGANIGSISIPIAKLRKDITVIAVEASPRVFSYLKYNVEINELADRFHLYNYALTNRDNDSVKFFSPVEKFGKGSLSPVFTSDSETISTMTLDTILNDEKFSEIGFVKIDVEGYESLVFKGANKLLTGIDSADVLFEFADWAEDQAFDVNVGDSQKILLGHGYKLFIADSISDLKELDSALTNGCHMLYASKK